MRETFGQKRIVVVLVTLIFIFGYSLELFAADKFPKFIVGGRKGGFSDGTYRTAEFRQPYSAAVLGDYLYITDLGNHCIRQINLRNKKVSTFTGGALNTRKPEEMKGYRDATKSMAQFNEPKGIAVGREGSIYIADSGNNMIRKIKGGVVSTLAGSEEAGYSDAQGGKARFNHPSDLVLMDDALYVADTANKAVRKVGFDGTVTTVFQGGDMIEPVGLYAYNGILYVVDSGAHAVFFYNPKTKSVNLLTGGLTRLDKDIGCRICGDFDGNIHEAKFGFPKSIFVDKEGIYIADAWSASIKRIAGERVSAWMLLKNEMFISSPTKFLISGKESIIVDHSNHQILFYKN